MIRAFYLLTAIPELLDNTFWIDEWMSVELAACVVALVCLIVAKLAFSS